MSDAGEALISIPQRAAPHPLKKTYSMPEFSRHKSLNSDTHLTCLLNDHPRLFSSTAPRFPRLSNISPAGPSQPITGTCLETAPVLKQKPMPEDHMGHTAGMQEQHSEAIRAVRTTPRRAGPLPDSLGGKATEGRTDSWPLG